KNKRFAIIAASLLIFGAGAIAYFNYIRPSSEPSLQIHKTAKPKVVKPTTLASPLTGLQVTPEAAARPVTGIMIENSQDARPQSGIDQAGVVYEAIAEGGITRFLTLYQDAQPQYVGPVRSLRPYYLDWLAPYDASIAHVGGSPEALAQVRSGMKDLDQFFNAGSYRRVSSRAAPHNVYTSFEKMDALNKAKGYVSSKFTPFTRKADAKIAVPTAKTINLAISGPTYNVHYDYDAATNSYLRSEGGAVHRATSSEADKTGQQLHPNVVVALIIPYSLVDGTGHSGYASTGSGQMFVFQDGGVTPGTWTKAGRTSQFSFADNGGAPIKLDAGQTWFTALGNAGMITYTP
ncbi:DUF3048 domain-containing protein, partial [Candidatus Saccharibacteria bacterium CG10_big_fil_rev_8_21_14_0_10_47_8]